jgi:hypothetical protein
LGYVRFGRFFLKLIWSPCLQSKERKRERNFIVSQMGACLHEILLLILAPLYREQYIHKLFLFLEISPRAISFHKLTRDRCYGHNFRRFLTIFGDKIGVFLKNQCYDQIFESFSLVLSKKRQFFGEINKKIITSVPDLFENFFFRRSSTFHLQLHYLHTIEQNHLSHSIRNN